MPGYLSFTKNRFFIVVAAIFFVVLLGLEYHQVSQQRSVQKEIDDLNKQADFYNKTNQSLSGSLSSYDSEFYKEKVARDQLNLKKDGEQVYSYSDSGSAATSSAAPVLTAPATVPIPAVALKPESNPKKWWNYFFNVQT